MRRSPGPGSLSLTMLSYRRRVARRGWVPDRWITILSRFSVRSSVKPLLILTPFICWRAARLRADALRARRAPLPYLVTLPDEPVSRVRSVASVVMTFSLARFLDLGWPHIKSING